jgi:tRNA(His) 5'-end guanylyltransferase
VGEATAALKRQGVSAKHELLFRNGINFNDLPAWQRRGIGLYWEEYAKEGYNPKERRTVTVSRRRVKIDRELPMKEEYGRLVRDIMAKHPTSQSGREASEPVE